MAQIEGSSQIRAPRPRVWALLNDPDVLARCTPGLTSLAPEGPDRYAATFTIALGPVKGTFQGRIEVADKVPDERMTLTVNARSPVGVVSARGTLRLEDEDGTTRVHWAGEPQLMGTLAAVGARLAQSVARSQAEVFFQKLEQEATQP